MNDRDLQEGHTAWLEDVEYRREYGSEGAKLEVATALAAARKSAGMTQVELAELAGVSQAYIAKLESGDANPSIGNIGRLFACMWLKPCISYGEMNPAASLGCVNPGEEIDMASLTSSERA